MYYSQAGQDKWVLSKVPKGYYVDVGAYDGIESSNTFALEQAGWEGLCIEPNKEAWLRLARNRSAVLANVACHFYNGECLFDGSSVVASGSSIECQRLDKILEQNHAPKVIDYLSIDVEGAEMAVLKGMDFVKYHVRLITIEHNAYSEGTERQEAIFEYLTSVGFIRTHKDVKCLTAPYEGLIYEDWYENSIHKS